MKKKMIFVGNTGFSLYNFRLPLMKTLQARGWSVIAAANDEADYATRFRKVGIGFIDVPMDHKGKNPLCDLFLVRRLRAIYLDEAPAAVHHFTIKPVIFGSIAARSASVPCIFNSVTGLGYAFGREGLLKHLVLMLYRRALSGRQQTIFQNPDDCTLFRVQRIVTEKNSHVIPGSGVDTDAILPAPAARKSSGCSFLMVSRMLWSKGVREYVSAAEMMRSTHPEVRFALAGGASGGGAKGNPDMVPEVWLREVNTRGAASWLGRLPFHEVLDELDRADVVVLASAYGEGIPKSLIEAAAKGKAIITTDAPGCREVVTHGVNGFLIPIRDIDALVNAMRIFIDKPHLIAVMGEEGRKKAVSIFDIKRIIAQHIDLYISSGVEL